ncbi:hypothetical protein C2G38_2049292 [Gigaspora rosea]|uniref:Uncharacterized protein n=1 Tax=Gigaspora rosea TaxID=44941 RepID=A0A397TZH2_9GLOM|nr:hypothetical protein C2G38_2049292 [Gigaspora rosea]
MDSDMLSSKSDMLSNESNTLSSVSDTLSSSGQSTIMEEVGLQSEVTQTIVDSGINFQPLSGEYGPYFKNFTEMSLFTWVTKHMITSNAYKDLMYIIEHPNFRPKHIIKNIRRLRSLRNRLPLQTIKCHQVLIQNMKTPSTSTPFKNSYTISISKHIRRVLGNRSLDRRCTSGLGSKPKQNLSFGMGISGRNHLFSAHPQFE